MATNPTAHMGDSVLVEFCVASRSTAAGSLTYKNLGMMRGKSVKVKRDTKDATADGSSVRESIVTKFVTMEISGDGVSRDEAAYNQQDIEAAVVSSGQPDVWFRITYANGKRYAAPCIVTEWENSSPYDDVCTWQLTASACGAITFTPGTTV